MGERGLAAGLCSLHRCGELRYSVGMKAKRGAGKKMKGTAQVRATISFPPEVYETLEGIARKKKVSLAWVVREAAEKYIEDKWPLFAKEERSS